MVGDIKLGVEKEREKEREREVKGDIWKEFCREWLNSEKIETDVITSTNNKTRQQDNYLNVLERIFCLKLLHRTNKFVIVDSYLLQYFVSIKIENLCK